MFFIRKDELIKKYGYPFEEHTTITDDGYILCLHRIPHSRGDRENYFSTRPPVLLMHGLGGSSADWILMGPGNSLGKYARELISRENLSKTLLPFPRRWIN
jgi:lysosomal acid lipase/cholesteryl ester hydrolase